MCLQVNRTLRDTILAPVLQHKIDLYAPDWNIIRQQESPSLTAKKPFHSTQISTCYARLKIGRWMSRRWELRNLRWRQVVYTLSSENQFGCAIQDSPHEEYRTRSGGSEHQSTIVPIQRIMIVSISEQMQSLSSRRKWCRECVGFQSQPRRLISTQQRSTNQNSSKELSDGGNHPAARRPTIERAHKYTRECILFTSITTSGDGGPRRSFVVWDWRSGRTLFVCWPFS